MKLTYDPKYNLAYLYLRDKPEEVDTIHISDELNIDISPDGSVCGIEFLNANEQLVKQNSGVLEFVNEASGQSSTIKLSG